MLCSHPWMVKPLGVTDKEWTLSREAKNAVTPRPCGQCIPCRINRARVWAQRIMMERLSSPDSLFVTLTYRDNELRHDGSLSPLDLTLFLKRLRYYLDGKPVRYFAVGEYSPVDRPHYHLILYGVTLADAKKIDEAWSMGFVHVGFLTEQSARYVTGYVVKGMKKNNPALRGRYPEFMRCSKMKPGGLGINAIRDVADSIKKSGVNPGLVTSLKVGRKSLPIGRYLREKLSEALGNENLSGAALADWQKELQTEFGDGVYLDNILKKEDDVRQRNIARYNFFKSRRHKA